MILGTGIDLIELSRIEDSYTRFGEKFLNRILRPEEVAYCLAHPHPAPHIAARFAAKEAVSKALGTGIGIELSWQDIEVARHTSGAPYVVMHGAGRRLMESRGAQRLHLSLTHSLQYAAAVAILES